jgi:hypothetical protein
MRRISDRREDAAILRVPLHLPIYQLELSPLNRLPIIPDVVLLELRRVVIQSRKVLAIGF